MKLVVFSLVGMLFVLPTYGQKVGIQFDRSMNWGDVVKKAAQENKYIFVDVMTTWCGPCQSMAQQVFPDEEVGKFFNEHFICVQVQLNKTEKDDEYVRAWYADADRIQKTYQIRTVPTLLFFNSKGEIVHSMPGATTSPKAFISLGQAALDENQQLYTRLRKYEAGERDVEFLYDLSVDLIMRGEKANAYKVANTFWQTITPEERLLDKGIRYANDFFSDINDSMASLFLKHPQEVDAVLGKGAATSKIVSAIEAKYVSPLVKDSVNIPDWQGLRKKLSERYPEVKNQLSEMLFIRQLWYGQRFGYDGICSSALTQLVPKYGERGDTMLVRNYAHELGVKALNKEERKIALDWLERTLDNSNAHLLLNYAEVLFLDGQKGKGLKCVNMALKMTEDGDKNHERALKMKKENAREMKLLKRVINEIN